VHPDITEFMPDANGSRRRQIKIDGITVHIEPHEDDAAAKRLALRLIGADKQRIFSPGYVRIRSKRVWLLGSREKGWSAFGYPFDGWDPLFRSFDVIVTEVGSDEHGPWWKVENRT